MDTREFIDATVDWLNRRVVPEGVRVDADSRLFEDGLIDSIRILRLIAWTEQAIGRRVADREIRMDRFASVRTMASHFVGSKTGSGDAAGIGNASGRGS